MQMSSFTYVHNWWLRIYGVSERGLSTHAECQTILWDILEKNTKSIGVGIDATLAKRRVLTSVNKKNLEWTDPDVTIMLANAAFNELKVHFSSDFKQKLCASNKSRGKIIILAFQNMYIFCLWFGSWQVDIALEFRRACCSPVPAFANYSIKTPNRSWNFHKSTPFFVIST